MFNKKQEMDRLWREIMKVEMEVRAELAVCKKEARRTKHYDSLCADMRKLKAEYEKVKGMGSFDPMSVSQNQTMMDRKRQGDKTGRTGPDSHHGLEDR